MKKTYVRGEICDRCGVEPKMARYIGGGCMIWGRYFPRHQWNEEPVTVDVVEIDPFRQARKLLASQGGRASADALTPEQRKARAIKARAARTEKARRRAQENQARP
jgi:hypothetical protein